MPSIASFLADDLSELVQKSGFDVPDRPVHVLEAWTSFLLM